MNETSSPADEAIRVNGLRKRYGSHSVLRDLELTVRTGETYALLGPNGTGKSTTVEILEGYRAPDSGEVRVLGEVPQHAGRRWRDAIGVVLQEAAQPGTMTVHEQLAHYARFYSRPRSVPELIEAVGLQVKANARISTLSGGQRRRLDVALALIGSPRVLFLDEPTTGFDPQARREFWTVIDGLKDHGTTILLTTHDMAEAANLADRIGVVGQGRIAHEGTPSTLGGPELRVPRVRWTEAGRSRCERTAHPGEFIAALVTRLGGEPAGLAVEHPGLEEIYLHLGAESAQQARRDREEHVV